MSTFGPVSIRTGQEDILFCPKDDEPLPMFDRFIGKAHEASSSSAAGPHDSLGVVQKGLGRGGGERGREHGNGNGTGGGVVRGGGGRMAGGIRGGGARSSAAAGPAAEGPAAAAATAAAMAFKKPTMPPPAYSSLPLPRESPPAVPPPLGGAEGRPTLPSRSASAQNFRRRDPAADPSEDPTNRRMMSGGPSMHPRNNVGMR